MLYVGSLLSRLKDPEILVMYEMALASGTEGCEDMFGIEVDTFTTLYLECGLFNLIIAFVQLVCIFCLKRLSTQYLT